MIGYFSIAIPLAYTSYSMVAVLDSHIKVMLAQADSSKNSPSAARNAENESSYYLGKVGSKLRKLDLPFTHPDYEVGAEPHAHELSDILNIRAGIIYAWLSVLLFSIVVLGLITPSIQRSFARLNSTIEKLVKDQLDEGINISGPKNMLQMSAGLENLRLRLIANEKDQTLFLRHISHEIKTPLTSIKEGSKLLEQEILGPVNQEQKEVAHILVKNCSALQAAIENLLNYNSAISIRKIKRRNKVDLAILVRRAIEKHAIQIRQKKIQLEKELHVSRAFVDEEQILTVFENLVSNAVKYSPTGGKITLRLRRTKNNKSEFCIQDNGPGVSDRQRDAIFNAFFVGDQAMHRTLKGTGLGLSIAKQYVEAHKGSIKLLSSRNGATFQVILS